MRLQPTDIHVLEALDGEGRSTPQLVADEIDTSNTYVRERLLELHDDGLVERPARGVYQLTDRGRRALKYRDLNGSDLYDAAIEGDIEGEIRIGEATITA